MSAAPNTGSIRTDADVDAEADKLSLFRAIFMGLVVDPTVEWRERFRWFRGLHIRDQLLSGDQWTPEQIEQARRAHGI